MSTTIDDSYIPDLDYGDFDDGGGNRRAVILILIAILIMAIGALVYWRVAVYKPGKQTLASIRNTTETHSMGQQTMNLSDGTLVQVTVVLQLTTVAEKSEITKDADKLNNAEIFTFGSVSDQQLLTDQGKAKVQSELLTRFNQILGPVDKFPQVQGVLFTNLVATGSGAPAE